RKFLRALPGRSSRDVDVTLRIHGDVVWTCDLSGRAPFLRKLADDFHAVATQNPDAMLRAVAYINELLLRIMRERDRERAALAFARDAFLDEFAVTFENLDAAVGAIGYIDQSIVRTRDAVRDVVLRRRSRIRPVAGFVIRLFSIRAPMPQILSGFGVED